MAAHPVQTKRCRPEQASQPTERLRPAQHRARSGQSGGAATTPRHYADPVLEVDRRAAAYLAKLTAGSAAQSSR